MLLLTWQPGTCVLTRRAAQVTAQFEALREPWWTDVDAARAPDDVAADVTAAAMAAVARARAGEALRLLWQAK